MSDATSAARLSSAAGASHISFWDAFRFWLKLGFISFGGPAGQISIMHQELVENRRWISERRFLHAQNYCMVLPGPEAQQLATYISIIGGRIAPTKFAVGGRHTEFERAPGPSIIDDDTPAPAHARFNWPRFGWLVLIGPMLWLVPMLVLMAAYGWNHTLTQMSWFFTKAALLTFSGARRCP